VSSAILSRTSSKPVVGKPTIGKYRVLRTRLRSGELPSSSRLRPDRSPRQAIHGGKRQVIQTIFLLIGLYMLEYSIWVFILYFYSKKYNLLNYIILVFLLTVVILFYIYLQIYLPTRSHICTQRESINKWLLLLLKRSSLLL